jgi:kynurenine formamidase
MSRIVDLTATISTATGVIGHPPVRLEPIHTHEKHGRANTQITLSLHTGTHVDAPVHFDPRGIGVDAIALERLIGPAMKIDLRQRAKPKTAITVEDIRQAPGFAEPLADHIVVLHTGWNKAMFGKPNYYTDNPYLTTATAEWLAAQRIRALGLDTPQDKYEGEPRHGDFPVHRTFLCKGIPFIEHIDNLDRVDRDRFQLIALPIKVQGADGAPARVVAVLE